MSLDWDKSEAEAEVVAAEARRAAVATRRLAAAGAAVPAAATVHADRARLWTFGVCDDARWVVSPPVSAPLPDIAAHVIETK